MITKEKFGNKISLPLFEKLLENGKILFPLNIVDSIQSIIAKHHSKLIIDYA